MSASGGGSGAGRLGGNGVGGSTGLDRAKRRGDARSNPLAAHRLGFREARADVVRAPGALDGVRTPRRLPDGLLKTRRLRDDHRVAALVEIDDGIWTLDGGTIPFYAPPIPVRFTYAQRAVVVRLPDGSLFVDSPIALDDGIRVELARLGPVRCLVSPNKLHHLFMGQWARAYPDADLYASPGLAKKRPDLRFDAVLGDAAPAPWAECIEQRVVRGSVFMEEVVFFHRPSRTLVLGDLIENHDPRLLGPVQRFWARCNGMLAPNGSTPRNYRLSFVRRDQTRKCLERVLAWEPRRVVVLHGPCVLTDPGPFLEHGFHWALG